MVAHGFVDGRFEARACFRVRNAGVVGLLAVLVVIAFAAYLVAPHWQMAACALALLFLLQFGLTVELSQRRRGRPTLVMDAEVFDHAWFGPIRWADIHGIALTTTVRRYGQSHVLVLGVADPARCAARTPWIVRVMLQMRFRDDPPFGNLRIPVDGLDCGPWACHEAAREFRADVDPPLRAGWSEWMSPAQVATLAAVAAGVDDTPHARRNLQYVRAAALRDVGRQEQARRDARHERAMAWLGVLVLAAILGLAAIGLAAG